MKRGKVKAYIPPNDISFLFRDIEFQLSFDKGFSTFKTNWFNSLYITAVKVASIHVIKPLPKFWLESDYSNSLS